MIILHVFHALNYRCAIIIAEMQDSKWESLKIVY